MKLASMILGILAGLGLLGWGLIGYGVGALGSMAGDSMGGLVKLASIVIPIAVLVGAGIVMKKPLIGGALMVAGALIVLFMVGLNFVGEYIAMPALVAGILGLVGSREQTNEAKTSG